SHDSRLSSRFCCSHASSSRTAPGGGASRLLTPCTSPTRSLGAPPWVPSANTKMRAPCQPTRRPSRSVTSPPAAPAKVVPRRAPPPALWTSSPVYENVRITGRAPLSPPAVCPQTAGAPQVIAASTLIAPSSSRVLAFIVQPSSSTVEYGHVRILRIAARGSRLCWQAKNPVARSRG